MKIHRLYVCSFSDTLQSQEWRGPSGSQNYNRLPSLGSFFQTSDVMPPSASRLFAGASAPVNNFISGSPFSICG